MIAVTGGNGQLGSFLIRKLIDTGESFVALRRSGSNVSLLDDVSDKIAWRDADIMDPVSLRKALHGITKVIHTAATVSFNPRLAHQVMDINIIGTRNIVNICLDIGVDRLVHVSSVAALGRQKGQQHIDETNKWIDTPFNNVYAKSKHLAELEVFRGLEEGLSAVIINPSLILAGANWDVSSARLFKYAWDEKPFYMDGFVNFVDVNDVSEIIYSLLHDDVRGERYIASSGKISYKDLLTKMALYFNKKPPSVKLTQAVLKPAAVIEGFRSWVTGGEPLITRETARLAGSEFVFENTKIRNKLNFQFQPIDETLKRCCRYYTERMNDKK
ncbi:MAG TPA: NAD-dependent epimerase/dehydratase family protein [Chryseolinea sp.]|nr:NAD-dependent epimerase/dehydratase family protein [Chryseolinea sp.]